MAETSVIETTDQRFETDVLIRSQLGLVIVDFWADWCAPCRMLAPVLEKLAAEYAERLTLVKANTEHNPQASQRFGVSGIPAVFAVLDGEVVNSFQGALPEDSIRAWLEDCLGSSQLLEIKQRMETEPEQAEEELRALRRGGKHADEAAVLLIELLFRQQRDEECRGLLDEQARRGFLEPACERIQAELTLRKNSGADLSQLKAAAAANANDFQAQFELAEALAAQQEYPAALDICLTLVERDRRTTGEQARLLMIDVFRVLGDDSEITRDYRRRLSMLLY